ncbi:BlaI/MecI/CopY family transcriptional regulator [Streptomyces sp900116325]|uniref:BlaI/MecI/CopY family transcriptional regulator n=1 Tax=unclassified Streptomyces TaxID=2593676 RepID=UPI0033A18835
MRRLGELEAEIMDRLWTWHRPATVREIVNDLNSQRPEHPAAYTTVNTVADILYRKELLRRVGKSGRAWLYEAARSRDSYTAALMQDALGSSPDPSATLMRFVEQISVEEAEALQQALRTVRQ